MSSRVEQKAQAREARRAAERDAAAAAARRRRLSRLAALLLAAAAVVALAVLVSQSGSDDAAAPPSERAALFADIPQDGEWLGRPSAPVVLEEYADLQCPFCATFAADQLPGIVRDYVRTGRVRLRLRVLTFLGPDSLRAGRAVAAAGLQDRQWQLVHELYAEQGQENSGYATDGFLRERAAAVPGLDVDRMLADRADRRVTEQLATARREQAKAGVESTPAFVAGRRGDDPKLVKGDVRSALDALLAGT